MVLPAYLVSSGLGSKVSRWLTPPFMNSQMTLLAFGGKCGLPSGGAQAPSEPRATPSRCEHGAQGQAGEAHAQVGEEGPAGIAAAGGSPIGLAMGRSPVSGW